MMICGLRPLNRRIRLLVSGHDAQTCRIAYQSPVPLASVRLTVDAPEFIGAEMVVELWTESGVCERTLTMPVNQMQLVTPAYRGAPLSDGFATCGYQ